MSEHTPEPTTFQKAVEAVLNVAPGEIPVDGAPLIVRAVLEAVMEPNPDMLLAAEGAPESSSWNETTTREWQAMLSTILREGE